MGYLKDVDDEIITPSDIRRCHLLLDHAKVPRFDDAGQILSLKWRLHHLTAVMQRVS